MRRLAPDCTSKGVNIMAHSDVQSAKMHFYGQLDSLRAISGKPGITPPQCMSMVGEIIAQDIPGWKLENVPLTVFGMRHVLAGCSGSLYLMDDDGGYEQALVVFINEQCVWVHPLLTLESIVALIESLELLLLEIHFRLEMAP